RAEEATKALRHAVRLQPEVAGVHYALAFHHFEHGEYFDSVQPFEKAIERDARMEPAHFHLAEAKRHLGEQEAAVDAYKAAIAIDPHRAESHRGLGLSLRALRRFVE